jgi:hypothetical protein
LTAAQPVLQPLPVAPDIVAITRTKRQKWLPSAGMVMLIILESAHWFQRSADSGVDRAISTFTFYWFATFVPLTALVVALNLLPLQLELGGETLVIRAPLRRRRVLYWREIQSIRVDQRGSRYRIHVYGDDPDGKRTVLPVPYSAGFARDPKFRDKYHLIGQFWLIHRGDEWRQLPPPDVNWFAADGNRDPSVG